MGTEERREMLFWTKEEHERFTDAMMDKPVSFYSDGRVDIFGSSGGM